MRAFYFRVLNMNVYVCPICNNSDPTYIGFRNNHPYCRKCLTFKGKEENDSFREPKQVNLNLNYRLSKEQKALSKQLIDNFKNGVDSLVKAVCGSGKTEICFGIISYCIRHGLTVGFAVPRTNVCIELHARFSRVFHNNKVIAVYGGHHNVLKGDLIALTTHQLFRYKSYFDLLILDEIDAFPFKGDDVLEAMFINSVRGNFVLMSATPDNQIVSNIKKEGGEVLELYSRFHKHPLPVPNVISGNIIYLNYKLITND